MTLSFRFCLVIAFTLLMVVGGPVFAGCDSTWQIQSCTYGISSSGGLACTVTASLPSGGSLGWSVSASPTTPFDETTCALCGPGIAAVVETTYSGICLEGSGRCRPRTWCDLVLNGGGCDPISNPGCESPLCEDPLQSHLASQPLTQVRLRSEFFVSAHTLVMVDRCDGFSTNLSLHGFTCETAQAIAFVSMVDPETGTVPRDTVLGKDIDHASNQLVRLVELLGSTSPRLLGQESTIKAIRYATKDEGRTPVILRGSTLRVEVVFSDLSRNATMAFGWGNIPVHGDNRAFEFGPYPMALSLSNEADPSARQDQYGQWWSADPRQVTAAFAKLGVVVEVIPRAEFLSQPSFFLQ